MSNVIGPLSSLEYLLRLRNVDGVNSGLDTDLWQDKSPNELTTERPLIKIINSDLDCISIEVDTPIQLEILNFREDIKYFLVVGTA